MLRPRPVLIAAFILITTSLQAAPRRRAVLPPTEFSAVDVIARQAVASGIPGVSIAILRGDKPLFAKAYGYDDAATKVWSTPDSIYEIGSITKQFTAAAIMRLVELGRLRVDEKAGTFVPELDSRFATITVEHLLTHTSGIVEYNGLLTSAYTPKSESEMLKLITSRAPLFAAGTNWQYSNSNYYLLGLIVQRLTAETYQHWLEQNFILPLGLTHTTYCTPSSPSGYARNGDTIAAVQHADMSLLFAAGAVCSTATDLARWNHALVTGRVVSSLSYGKMSKPYRVSSGQSTSYGYALVINTLDGHKRIWHDGAVLGYMANLAWYPDDDLTIAVLTNLVDLQLQHSYGTEISDAIARALLK